MLADFTQYGDVGGRVVDVHGGLDAVFQSGEAERHVRDVVVVEPFGGVRDDDAMLPGYEQPVRDDADVHVFVGQSLQGVCDAWNGLHGRVEVLLFGCLVGCDVFGFAGEWPAVVVGECVSCVCGDGLRVHTAGAYQVVAHGARIVGAYAVQIQVEYPVSAYADLLVGVLFRNRWRCPHVTLPFTVSQYVSRQAAVWSLAVRRFDEPSSYASSRYRLSAIVSCVMPVATFRTNGYTGQIIHLLLP